jgi:hypothetical protein
MGLDASFNNVVISLLRNGSAVGLPSSTFGPQTGGGIALLTPFSINAYDKPNSAATQLYQFYVNNTNGSATVSFNNGSVTIEEIMG